MDRSNKGLLILAAVLVAWSGMRLMQDAQPPAKLFSIPALVAEDIISVRFEGPDGALAVKRTGGGWTVTEPESLPADSRKVEALLSDWTGGFSADLRVSENADTDQELRYGLDAEHRTVIELLGKDGLQVELELGKSIGGGSHYLRDSGSPVVYRGRVPGSARLKPSVAQWEDRRLLPDLGSEMVRLEVSGSHGPIVFSRGSSSEDWQAGDLTELKLANSKINALARSLGNFTARSILRGSVAQEQRATAGLEPPRVTISVVDTAGQTSTVLLGSDHKDKGFVWGQLQGDPRLFVLPKSILSNFDKDTAGLGGG